MQDCQGMRVFAVRAGSACVVALPDIWFYDDSTFAVIVRVLFQSLPKFPRKPLLGQEQYINAVPLAPAFP
jgi:hypothetical protein